MKKATKILYIAGGAVGIVWAVCFLISAIMMFVVGGVGVGHEAEIIQYINENYPEIAGKFTPEMIEAFFAVAFTIGAVLIVFTVCAVASGVLSFIGNKKQNRVLAILNIVFGVLGVTIVPIVAGVFNLIVLGQEDENKQIEEKKEEK